MKKQFLTNRSKQELINIAENLGINSKKLPMEKLIKKISVYSYQKIKNAFYEKHTQS